MTETIQCISLRVVRYSDTKSIVTVWSRQRGRMALSVASGTTPKARRLRALLQPMCVIECVAHLRPGQEIATVSDVRPLGQAISMTGDPLRSIIALFMADFLYAVLRESAPDALIWDYLYEQTQELATMPAKALPNYHLAFVYRLTQFLGIEPDVGDYRPDAVFDMREARYTASRPTHNQYVEGDAARLPMLLSRLRPRTLHLLRLSRDERNAALDAMLQYYAMHYAPLPALPSLAVLRDLSR